MSRGGNPSSVFRPTPTNTPAPISALLTGGRQIGSPTFSGGYLATILGDSPIAGWRLGEAVGATVAADYFGHTPGTYTNAPTLGVSGIPGSNGDTAITLAGTAYVSVPVTTTLDLGNGPLSVEAWIKRSATQGTNQGICSRSTGGYYLRVNNANQLEFLKSQIAVVATVTATLTDTTSWHHVVATKTGSTTLIYLDGVVQVTTGSDATLINPDHVAFPNCYVGSDLNNTEPFQGSLDEVWVYNSVLSPAHIANHYSQGISTATPLALVQGNWTTELGSTTNEYLSIGEVSPSDYDYVQSGLVPTADVLEVPFGALLTPDPAGPDKVLHYRYDKQADGMQVNLTVDLMYVKHTPLVMVQHTSAITPSSDTTVTSTAITTTTGNLLVLGVAGGVPGVAPVTDTYNNTWINVESFTQSGSTKYQLWYAQNAIGGANHTVTWTVGSASPLSLGLWEISGSDASAAFDMVPVAIRGTTQTSLTSNNVVPAQANEIILVFGTVNHTETSQTLADAGSTPTTWTVDEIASDPIGRSVLLGHSIVSALGTYAVTETISDIGVFVLGLAAFKQINPANDLAVIQTWQHNDVPSAWTGADQVITNAIPSYDALYVRFTATQP